MKLPGTPTQRKWASRAAIVVAIGAAYYLFTQVLDLEKILEDVANALGAWTYALVGFFAFAETGAFIGLVAPGETVMLLGGAVAGQGAIDLYVTIPKGLFPEQDTGFLFGQAEAREDISFALMVEREHQLAAIVLEDPAVFSVSGFAGTSSFN